MKIAYIPQFDPYDKHSWSGTDFYTRKALEDAGNDVYCIYGFNPRMTFSMILYKIKAKLQGKHFMEYRTHAYSIQWANYILKQLKPGTEAIFSLKTTAIADLQTDIPIFLYGDSCFEQLRFQYCWNDLSDDCIKFANEIEKNAFVRARHVFSCAHETGKAIEKFYNIPHSKISIVPLGANLDNEPTVQEVTKAIKSRSPEECNIIFIGVEWERKGADIVLRTAEVLHEKGLKLKLHICGIRNIPVTLPDYVVNHGFLKKNDKQENEVLINTLKSSHFLFVPSREEAYGLVFCEASAYGVPCISHRRGGMITIIENDVNGQLFNIGTEPEIIADYIITTFSNQAAYNKLAETTYQRYKDYLCWSKSGKKLTEIMIDCVYK